MTRRCPLSQYLKRDILGWKSIVAIVTWELTSYTVDIQKVYRRPHGSHIEVMWWSDIPCPNHKAMYGWAEGHKLNPFSSTEIHSYFLFYSYIWESLLEEILFYNFLFQYIDFRLVGILQCPPFHIYYCLWKIVKGYTLDRSFFMFLV
jgi:hypothetical protein